MFDQNLLTKTLQEKSYLKEKAWSFFKDHSSGKDDFEVWYRLACALLSTLPQLSDEDVMPETLPQSLLAQEIISHDDIAKMFD